MATRYAFIDAIRGVAACSVMLQHSLYSSGLLVHFGHIKRGCFQKHYLNPGATSCFPWSVSQFPPWACNLSACFSQYVSSTVATTKGQDVCG
jgi:hypothetical protein